MSFVSRSLHAPLNRQTGMHLKRECDDIQWSFQPFCVGKNNGGHQERSRKFIGEPRTEWWPRFDRQSWPKQLFQAEHAAGGPCTLGWLFCRLLTGAVDSLSAAKLRPWEKFSPPTLAPTIKRSVSWSDNRRLAFFFFVGSTTVTSPDGQQDVQCSKVHLLAERSWTVRALSV